RPETGRITLTITNTTAPLPATPATFHDREGHTARNRPDHPHDHRHGRRSRARTHLRPGGIAQTLKPSARSCSRPSSVILSGPHGGIQTQLIRTSSTQGAKALRVWSSMTSV